MRSRLVLGVAVAGLTVLAAGTPAVVSATRELNDSQQLVTLAEQTQHTLTLAHLLGDERDAVVEYVAKGRPGAQAKGPVQERTALTDRQLAEVQNEADEALARALGRVQAVRSEAVDGKGSALAAQQAYTGVIAELLAPGDRLAELTPPRAVAALATTRPLAPLGQAVDQASATRGLLLAALAVPRGEQSSNTAAVDELTTAAQRARVREQAALDDFTRVARPDVRQTLAATVTGPEVKTADDYLKRLTERPTLSTADRKLDGATVAPALTARIDRMRSVESTLAGQRATALATLRDDDVTRLEMLVAVLGLLFLVAVGFSTAVARSLTRPLSVLRRGAARLATPEGSVEPVRFTGRNDEFAEVVRHLNAVRDQTVSLHTRIAGLVADGRRLIGRNEALTSGRDALEQELTELRAGLEEHRRVMSTTSVSLSLRTLGLVERQLAVIEELESKEQDPDRLATLFKMDHLATVMRRHNENLLVLAGQEHGHGAGAPVPLVDVMRAAVSEIERYERVDLAALPPFTQVAGHAADDISHVLAELLENATTFSPPEAKVKVSGRLLESGDVVLSVVDEGIGVSGDRLDALNARLATPEAYDEEPEAEHGLGLGLYVAGRLAARHGVTAELRAPRHGGTEALVVVPAALLPVTPPTSPVHTFASPGMPELQLPGVIAEANENTIPPRRVPPVAERDAELLAQAEAGAEPEPAPFRDLGPEADAELLRSMEWDTETPEAAEASALGPDLAQLPDFGPDAAAGPGPDPDALPGEATAATEAPLPGAQPAPGAAPDADADLAPEFAPDPAGGPEPDPDAPLGGAAAAAEASPPGAEPVPDPVSGTDGAAEVSGAELAPDFGPDLAGGLEPDADAHGLAVDGGLPPTDRVFAAGHAFADPEGVLPPTDQVFTVPAPAEELLARVVPDAAPEADGAEEVPVERDPGDELLARVVPDAGPEAFAGSDPDPASPDPLPDAGPLADVSEQGLTLPGQTGTATAFAPDGSAEPHRHAPAEAGWVPRQGSHPEQAPEAVTGKGLPKRTPRAVAAGRTARTEAVRPDPPRRVDAEELRRRLGGFYQGTRDGRRVAAAELAQDTDQGDTAQEART
ncbi:nitrate- and nitrite sensing domain-containing protein [Streptomyces sp. NPDC050448]|uniref:nitrate- and nitrite sensing domain-containing protein n=1 Tax=Streptomyces sp. NPDC050448 TaxID=3155404 RepID=UPI00343770E9